MSLSKSDRSSLKSYLRQHAIKLWKPPYTLEDGTASIPSDLIQQVAQELAMDPTTVALGIEDLRQSSLQHAASRKSRVGGEPQDANPPTSASAAEGDTVVDKEQDSGDSLDAASADGEGGLRHRLKSLFKGKKPKEMVSFENDAFFLAKETAATQMAPDTAEVPVYFDDLTPEQQAEYEKKIQAEMMSKEGEDQGKQWEESKAVDKAVDKAAQQDQQDEVTVLGEGANAAGAEQAAEQQPASEEEGQALEDDAGQQEECDEDDEDDAESGDQTHQTEDIAEQSVEPSTPSDAANPFLAGIDAHQKANDAGDAGDVGVSTDADGDDAEQSETMPTPSVQVSGVTIEGTSTDAASPDADASSAGSATIADAASSSDAESDWHDESLDTLSDVPFRTKSVVSYKRSPSGAHLIPAEQVDAVLAQAAKDTQAPVIEQGQASSSSTPTEHTEGVAVRPSAIGGQELGAPVSEPTTDTSTTTTPATAEATTDPVGEADPSTTQGKGEKEKKHGKLHFLKKLRPKKKQDVGRLPPMQRPIVQPVSEFRANEMKMTDAQRIAVMSMVKDGELSIDDAIAKVKAVEELLALGKLGPQGSQPQQLRRKASRVRISDEERNAIMRRVKKGQLTVEQGINMILEVEDQMNTTSNVEVTDDDIEHVLRAMQGGVALQHNTRQRPKVDHRKPTRNQVRARRSGVQSNLFSTDPVQHMQQATTATKTSPAHKRKAKSKPPPVPTTAAPPAPSASVTEATTPTLDTPVCDHDSMEGESTLRIPSGRQALQQPQSIEAWLEALSMQKYLETFVSAGFDDMDFVGDLTREDLISIGIVDTEDQATLLHDAQMHPTPSNVGSIASLDQLHEQALKSDDATNADRLTEALEQAAETATTTASGESDSEGPNTTLAPKEPGQPVAADQVENVPSTPTPTAVASMPETEPKAGPSPQFLASQSKLSDEERIKVMTLVKDGKLTVEEAMRRVINVESSLQKKEQPPEVDEEGFVVVKKMAGSNPFSASHEDIFKAAFEEDGEDGDDVSDDDDDEDEDEEGDSIASDGRERSGSSSGDIAAAKQKKKKIQVSIRPAEVPSVDPTNPFAVPVSSASVSAQASEAFTAGTPDDGPVSESEGSAITSAETDGPPSSIEAKQQDQDEEDTQEQKAKSTDPSADPFSDPFSAPSKPAVFSSDPFASPSTSADANDPFAAPFSDTDTPALETPTKTTTNDPFAMSSASDAGADPFATSSSEAFAVTFGGASSTNALVTTVTANDTKRDDEAQPKDPLAGEQVDVGSVEQLPSAVQQQDQATVQEEATAEEVKGTEATERATERATEETVALEGESTSGQEKDAEQSVEEESSIQTQIAEVEDKGEVVDEAEQPQVKVAEAQDTTPVPNTDASPDSSITTATVTSSAPPPTKPKKQAPPPVKPKVATTEPPPTRPRTTSTSKKAPPPPKPKTPKAADKVPSVTPKPKPTPAPTPKATPKPAVVPPTKPRVEQPQQAAKASTTATKVPPPVAQKSFKKRLAAPVIADEPTPTTKVKPAASEPAKQEKVGIGHSRIYEALNAKPLWAEAQQGEKEVIKLDQATSRSLRSAAMFGGDDVDVADDEDLALADQRIQALREQAQASMAHFDKITEEIEGGQDDGSAAHSEDATDAVQLRPKKQKEKGNPFDSSNPFGSPSRESNSSVDTRRESVVSVSSINFDSEFLAELERRRAERAEEEERHAAELRKKFEEEQASAMAVLSVEQQKFAEERRLELEREERAKLQAMKEAQERAKEMQFSFQW
eukprot:m.183597 g.183597  ORF g.183597 m.183597 type:complete len:1769 (-) comp14695_c1_seq1:403-5709(-)